MTVFSNVYICKKRIRTAMGIGFQELIVIFLIVLLLFGAKRLPEIARSLGKASNEFKKAKDEITSSYDDNQQRPTEPPKAE